MSSSRTTRWAHGVVVDWTLRLTHGLPDAVARDRFDQIVSDLWEQEHDSSSRVLGAAILIRLLRGIPADLAWRAHVLAVSTSAAPKTWVPMQPGTKPFDQTNGAVELESAVRTPDEGAEVRDLLGKAVASNAAFGLFGGGGIG